MSYLPPVKLSRATHRDMVVIRFSFAYNTGFLTLLKQLPGFKWSQAMNCWYQPHDQFDLNKIFELFKGKAWVDFTGLRSKAGEQAQDSHPVKTLSDKLLIPEGYLEKLQQKRYSENTIKSYVHYMKDFTAAMQGKPLPDITPEEINHYILLLIKEKQISVSQQNIRINAIKFYYEKVLGNKREVYNIDRPRKEQTLPDVLSKEEVGSMLKVARNKKHKCLIALIYSCGLRRSEAINIEVKDIDSGRMVIKIRGGKGKKDRYVQLASGLLDLLREYYREYQPGKWLFEGQRGGRYGAETVLRVVKDIGLKAGIKRRIDAHMLRHSYATHQIEQGVDIRFIQEWLGHVSIKTTQRYTHIAETNFKNFKNPLDDLL